MLARCLIAAFGLAACATPKIPWEHGSHALDNPQADFAEPSQATIVHSPGRGGGLLPGDDLRHRYMTTPAAEIGDPSVAEPWPASRSSLTLAWPLPATGVTSLFGRRNDPLDGTDRFHYGIDLEAPYGSIVSTCAAGTVTSAGWNAGHGRQVVVEHRGGYRTSYSHLSLVLVEPGTRIAQGQPVGLVGNSGRSTGPHLHLEVIHRGTYVDPLEVLGSPGTHDSP